MGSISPSLPHGSIKLADHRTGLASQKTANPKAADQNTIDAAASASGSKCGRSLAVLAAVAAGLAVVAFGLLALLSVGTAIAAGVSGAGAPAILPSVASALLNTGAAICAGLLCYRAIQMI